MSPPATFLHRFLRDGTGAVTVDYVVLAAAVTFVALLASDILEGGMRSLAGTVDSELKGEAPGATTGLSYSDGFDNGAQGWAGAVSTDIAGIGHVLGPIGNTGGAPSVNRDFAIDPGADRAVFEFDLLSMDNLDGDTGTVFIDGAAVGSVTVSDGVPVFTAAGDLEARGIIVRYGEVDRATHLGGNAAHVDARSTFLISVRNDPSNPRGTINLGFGSDATAGADNEFFAIDNLTATGLAGG